MWLVSGFVFDGFPIPITLQTCGIQIIAFFMSPSSAFLSVGLWIVLGASGVSCFANGAKGIAHVMGLRGGYFWGFLFAASLISFLYRYCLSRELNRVTSFALSSLVGHAFILFFGWMFILPHLGWHESWCLGVRPFLLLPICKSVVFSIFLSVMEYFFSVHHLKREEK